MPFTLGDKIVAAKHALFTTIIDGPLQPEVPLPIDSNRYKVKHNHATLTVKTDNGLKTSCQLGLSN